MSNLRRGRRISWIVTLACVLLPASASGAVTVGSNLAAAPVEGAVACGSAEAPCTSSHQELPAGSVAAGGLLAPTDGVVVRWRVKVGAVTGPVALRITTPGDADTRTGSGTSAEVTPTVNDVSTFGPVRLPIGAGDSLGIDYSTTTAFASTADASSPVWDPALADGELPRLASGAEAELLINADVEPDADGDGFGDETQDQCPTDPSTQGLCPIEPPPEPPGPEPPAPEPPDPDGEWRLQVSVDRRVEMYKRASVIAEGFASSQSALRVYAVPHANACPLRPSRRGPRPKHILSSSAVQGQFRLKKRVKLKSSGGHSFCGYLGPIEGSGYVTAFKQRRVMRPHLKAPRARRTVTRALRRHKFAGRVVKHLERTCRRRNRSKFSCRFSSVFPGYKLTGRGTVRLDRRLTYRFRIRVGGLSIVLKPGNEGRFPG